MQDETKTPEPIKLFDTIKRGETTIDSITLRRPNARDLAGLTLQGVVRGDVASIQALAPRISSPILTPHEAQALDPSDLMAIAAVVIEQLVVMVGEYDTPEGIKLFAPLDRNGEKITHIALRRPLAPDLRGFAMQDLLIGNVQAVQALIPRISTPRLTEREAKELDPADLMSITSEVIDFLAGSAST